MEAVDSRSSEWMCHTFQWCFARVKNIIVKIKDLMKCYDVVLINICVIRIISLFIIV